MAIKIQITIHDSDVEHLFNSEALSIIGAIDKNEEVSKAIAKQIDKKLSSNGIKATINCRTI